MIAGVDRSHHNSPIQLAKLVTKGVKFVWFKASEGLTYVDPTFYENWKEAKATSGLIRGAYHFYDPRVDGIEQAKLFLSLKIDFSSEGCLMPCVDVEDLVVMGVGGRVDPVATAAANKWVANNWKLAELRLNDFLDHIKTTTGRDCIIYTYNNYPKEYFNGHGFPNNPMWLSSLQDTCPKRYDTGELPALWQNTYNWNGSDMDGDFYTGTIDELNKLSNIVTV